MSAAKYSISSFLKFNSEYQVILHVDQALYPKARILSFLFGNSVRVIQDQSGLIEPLDAKAKLLIELQGTFDIFVDADTRWNASLKLNESITVMTIEFLLQSDATWKNILSELNLKQSDFSMLNTTFFSWRGNDLGVSYKEYSDWKKAWTEIDWKALELGTLEITLKRLCEQVFMSYILRYKQVVALKDRDAISDGGILESSYLGATGHRFAR